MVSSVKNTLVDFGRSAAREISSLSDTTWMRIGGAVAGVVGFGVALYGMRAGYREMVQAETKHDSEGVCRGEAKVVESAAYSLSALCLLCARVAELAHSTLPHLAALLVHGGGFIFFGLGSLCSIGILAYNIKNCLEFKRSLAAPTDSKVIANVWNLELSPSQLHRRSKKEAADSFVNPTDTSLHKVSLLKEGNRQRLNMYYIAMAANILGLAALVAGVFLGMQALPIALYLASNGLNLMLGATYLKNRLQSIFRARLAAAT